MIIVLAMAGYLIAGAVIAFLLKRQSGMKEANFALKRQVVHAQANVEGARRAARTAEKQCIQALQNLKMSLAATGQAMEVAGQIEVVAGQIQDLFDYMGPPAETVPGRHALPGPGSVPAITGGAQDGQPYRQYRPFEEIQEAHFEQEEHAS